MTNHSLMKGMDQHELLLSCAIGYSDSAISRKFFVDNLTVSRIRHDLKKRYRILFRGLESYRSEAEKTGYASFDGKRKYIDGLRSSNIAKREQALEDAVRWLLRF